MITNKRLCYKTYFYRSMLIICSQNDRFLQENVHYQNNSKSISCGQAKNYGKFFKSYPKFISQRLHTITCFQVSSFKKGIDYFCYINHFRAQKIQKAYQHSLHNLPNSETKTREERKEEIQKKKKRGKKSYYRPISQQQTQKFYIKYHKVNFILFWKNGPP